MNQQPDKFFRDKLANYDKTAPLAAWEKIAAAKQAPLWRRPWLKVAASLVLALTAAGAWYWNGTGLRSAATETDRHSAHAPLPPAGNPSPSMPEKPALPPSRAGKVTLSPQGNNPVAIRTMPAVRSASAPRTASQGEPATSSPQITPGELQDETNSIQQRSTTGNLPSHNVVHQSEAQPALTLTYSVNDVAAYLDQNNTDLQATDTQESPSTLKKLLQKAGDLKTNQDPFGELRQRKNEILALNFRTDKRGQKTRN